VTRRLWRFTPGEYSLGDCDLELVHRLAVRTVRDNEKIVLTSNDFLGRVIAGVV
jgi:hypothetical protein